MKNGTIVKNLYSTLRKGKYFSLSLNKDVKDKELSLAEIEVLKKDHYVISLIQAEGCVTSKICTSEQEVIEQMRRDGEII